MMIATVCTFLLLWAMAFGSYALFNKGLAAKALRQQAIRYAVAAAVAVVPVAVAQAAPWQPRLLSVMLCSVAWMTAYPLTYHLTHRRTSPGYDLRIDQAFGLYTYALLSSLSLLAASLWPWQGARWACWSLPRSSSPSSSACGTCSSMPASTPTA